MTKPNWMDKDGPDWMGPAPVTNNWKVEVWFATSPNWKIVAKNLDEFTALKEALAYLSDSKGVCIVHEPTSIIQWIKRPKDEP